MPNTSILKTLSRPRMATYLSITNQDQTKALELYIWNSQVSAALLVPMHICEKANLQKQKSEPKLAFFVHMSTSFTT
ncbi:hypothetical protein UA24_19045 [Marinomonas sp. BSi20414]|nr:hypothetical protein [Marinomonas sp. BSi20414]GGN38913.1 hypothetical protein GCM10011350_39220 [Marinomonas arctica]